MSDYYSKRLSSNKLKRCYDLAPPRVKQYLRAEVDYVIEHIQQSDVVIELGCGYGRVLRDILPYSSVSIGIDTSYESLRFAGEYIGGSSRCHLFQSDASHLPVHDKSVDKVVCIQNGISAFKVDALRLIEECVRITRKGGSCLFSSYSDEFWTHRLDWFKLQSEEGLVGEIDWSLTSDGVIHCKDGFRATTFRHEDFEMLCTQLCLQATICEVDSSSVFCIISV
ncbi:MAG: class I SAM-dependent methyltransferase [Candidatus Thorarchaeota archaeon]|nr:class I SAM-dependent methyltransferase [Candidatus Thorarchaeota archaeon]